MLILAIFKLLPLKGTKSLRLYSWFIGTPALLLKKANVGKCSYVLSWKWWSSKVRHKTADFRPHAVLAITMPISVKISVNVEQWLKNHHTLFQDCSYHSLEDVRDWKQKFGQCVKLTLFSDPLTYCVYYYAVCVWGGGVAPPPISDIASKFDVVRLTLICENQWTDQTQPWLLQLHVPNAVWSWLYRLLHLWGSLVAQHQCFMQNHDFWDGKVGDVMLLGWESNTIESR